MRAWKLQDIKKKVIRLHFCHYTNVAVYETWFDFDIRDANMHYVLEMSGLHKDLCSNHPWYDLVGYMYYALYIKLHYIKAYYVFNFA